MSPLTIRRWIAANAGFAFETAMMTMIYDKLHTIRCFFRRLRIAGLPLTGRSTLLIAGAALLASISSGQVPTVTVLPYVIEYETFHVVPNVITVPATGQMSGFAALLGGGLGSILSEAVAPAALASATASVRALAVAQKTKIIQQVKDRMLQDAKNAQQNVKNQNPEVTECEEADVCTIPEEEQAEQAQEQLQAITESGEATQEAIEGAEAGAEAAEVSAEAAEVALETAEDVIEGLEIVASLADLL